MLSPLITPEFNKIMFECHFIQFVCISRRSGVDCTLILVGSNISLVCDVVKRHERRDRPWA
jgi:hypothetical protein